LNSPVDLLRRGGTVAPRLGGDSHAQRSEEKIMRTIVRRAPFWFAALGAAVGVSALAPAASAEPSLHLGPAARASMHARAAKAAHAPLVVDREARARAAVSLRSSFAATHASLQVTATDRFGDGDAIVHFEQMHGGLPVIGRGAAVRLSARGEEILTTLDLEADLPSVVPSLAPGAAASIAARFAPVALTKDDAHLVVWPLTGGGSRLAYVVLPAIPTGLATAPRIVVDAHTGKVIEARDLVRFAKANMYEFNPAKTPTLAPLDLALTPGATLTNEFVASYNCIDRKSVRALNIQGFKADVHVCDIDQLATADDGGDFLAYAPSDTPGAMESRSDAFSEVSMYYHTAKAYAFFRTLQGNPDAQVVADKPLRVVANLQIPAGISSGNILAAADPNTPLESFSNAFFSPAAGGLGAIFQQLYGLKGGGLWFGQGPQRDYAYDGDVVYHEFGHAVVDHSLKLGAWHVDARGAIDAPGAMNEGLADYFSSAITGDPDIGEYASKDISQNAGVLRTLANADACPTSIIGEVHFDSTLFSGALWSARTAVPAADRAAFDAALYKAMRTNPGRGDLGYDDLAKLFLATLGTDLPAGATALEAAMTARGVLPSCERIVEPKSGSVKAVEPAAGGFASPGIQSIPLGELAPGILQVHGKPAATDGSLVVTVTTRASSGGSANPLGGGGTPFTPVALVKFGKPITWTVSRSDATHDADKMVDMSAGTRPSATFEIPAGTTDVYVQIANKGESDGAYDNVALTFTPAAVTPGDDGVTSDPVPTAAAPETTTGCACSTVGGAEAPASSTALAGLLAALGLAAGVVRRRRG
jgi:MYXO-CTERM domain-containing protein